jgi:hypothetical protein
MKIELLAEGFNIFNRSNVTAVNTAYISTINFTTGVLTYNSGFLSTSTINNTGTLAPRQIQFGAKFRF